MRKASFFLILLVVSLISLVVLIVVGFIVFPSLSQPDWFGDMWGHMGGMMGGAGQVSNPYLIYFGVLFVVLVGFIVVGVAGIAYFLFFPEVITTRGISSRNDSFQTPKKSEGLETVLKTLTDDERKVLAVLEKNDGKYLQKYIRKEAELSRLKTHRILARLAERGIVTLKKTGNTNEVQIAQWLKKS